MTATTFECLDQGKDYILSPGAVNTVPEVR